MSREGLKTGVAVLLKRVGGLEAAASATRVGVSKLSEYQSRRMEDRHMPVDVVLDLEAIAGEPLVTAALARAAGYRLVRIEAGETGDVVSPVQAVTRDAGELAAQLMAAIADQEITADEADGLAALAQRMRGSLDDVLSALAARRGT